MRTFLLALFNLLLILCPFLFHTIPHIVFNVNSNNINSGFLRAMGGSYERVSGKGIKGKSWIDSK